MINTILQGDCLTVLKTLSDNSAQMCVTSPPYWNLRSYLSDDSPEKIYEVGQEQTPEQYVEKLREVFREVWRVLKEDGTLWLNLGDSMMDKELLGIPWRVALALQADGWCLRSDVIWAKLNIVPESVKDRPTRAHE